MILGRKKAFALGEKNGLVKGEKPGLGEEELGKRGRKVGKLFTSIFGSRLPKPRRTPARDSS